MNGLILQGKTEAKQELGVRLQVIRRQRFDGIRSLYGAGMFTPAQQCSDVHPHPPTNPQWLEEGLALCRPPRPSGELEGLRS